MHARINLAGTTEMGTTEGFMKGRAVAGCEVERSAVRRRGWQRVGLNGLRGLLWLDAFLGKGSGSRVWAARSYRMLGLLRAVVTIS